MTTKDVYNNPNRPMHFTVEVGDMDFEVHLAHPDDLPEAIRKAQVLAADLVPGVSPDCVAAAVMAAAASPDAVVGLTPEEEAADLMLDLIQTPWFESFYADHLHREDEAARIRSLIGPDDDENADDDDEDDEEEYEEDFAAEWARMGPLSPGGYPGAGTMDVQDIEAATGREYQTCELPEDGEATDEDTPEDHTLDHASTSSRRAKPGAHGDMDAQTKARMAHAKAMMATPPSLRVH
jgi:hypothetical protein